MAPRSSVLFLVSGVGVLGAGLAAIAVVLWLSRSPDDGGRGGEELSMEARRDAGEHPEKAGDQVGLSVEDPSRSPSVRASEVIPSVQPTSAPESAIKANAPVDWRSTYQKASLEELIREKESVSSEYEKRSSAELMKRFDAGLSEFLSSEMRWSGTTGTSGRSGTDHAEEIYSIQMVPNRGTFRAVLPRSEFPDLYEMRDKKVFLQDLVEKKLHPPGKGQ